MDYEYASFGLNDTHEVVLSKDKFLFVLDFDTHSRSLFEVAHHGSEESHNRENVNDLLCFVRCIVIFCQTKRQS